MFKDFNKKIVIKTTKKKEIIKSILSSLIGTIILYLLLTSYNDVVAAFLEISKKGDVLELAFIAFPLILIFNITITLGKLVLNGAFDKKGRK